MTISRMRPKNKICLGCFLGTLNHLLLTMVCGEHMGQVFRGNQFWLWAHEGETADRDIFIVFGGLDGKEIFVSRNTAAVGPRQAGQFLPSTEQRRS